MSYTTEDTSPSMRSFFIPQARRIVIKLGTAVLVNEKGMLGLSRFYSLVESIAQLKKSRHEVILVSSGAVGLGVFRLGLKESPQTLSLKQACAAVGQGRLMALYSDAFERLDVTAAQVLLTEEDLSNRHRYLNLRATLTKLLELGVIPVINENDTLSTNELKASNNSAYHKVNFGDNDKLSALVASKIDADMLIMLTDVEGLYVADKFGLDDSRPISLVEKITPEIETLTGLGKSKKSKQGRGGMKTKLEAAKIATHSGCAVVIASGKLPLVISRIFDGEDLGTFFIPQAELGGKRRWIAFATSVNAAIVVNEGAKTALLERQASLLPAGVLEVRGQFDRGDVVSVLDEDNIEFARGIVNYSSTEARRISGKHSKKINELIENRNYDALIKRENMALIERAES